MNITKRSFIKVLGLFVAIVFPASFVFMLWKDRKYIYSRPYRRKKDRPTDVVVIYYSRSGNTEAMAREIARKFQADIIKIAAKS